MYRKMHIPDDPGYSEKFYFTPGDLGFRVFGSPWGKCGLMLCWDQWFPEAARLATLQGARILLYPTAIGSHPADGTDERRRQQEAWELVQRSHGIVKRLFRDRRQSRRIRAGSGTVRERSGRFGGN